MKLSEIQNNYIQQRIKTKKADQARETKIARLAAQIQALKAESPKQNRIEWIEYLVKPIANELLKGYPDDVGYEVLIPLQGTSAEIQFYKKVDGVRDLADRHCISLTLTLGDAEKGHLRVTDYTPRAIVEEAGFVYPEKPITKDMDVDELHFWVRRSNGGHEGYLVYPDESSNSNTKLLCCWMPCISPATRMLVSSKHPLEPTYSCEEHIVSLLENEDTTIVSIPTSEKVIEKIEFQ